jgi:hypothetical protein
MLFKKKVDFGKAGKHELGQYVSDDGENMKIEGNIVIILSVKR